jgi:hypothetical protein
MKNRSVSRKLLRTLVVLAVSTQLIACGTLIYPERQGQRRGRLDPAILLLDGALLLLYVVPGLVAYGIDFYTGAIYFPASRGRASTIHLAPEELTAHNLEQIVLEQTGVEIEHDDARLLRLELDSEIDLLDALRRFEQSLDRPPGPPRPS